MKKIKVSMISTVLNEENNIRKFLDSILNQTKRPNEIIVIDGGSTDKTYKILKEYSKKHKLIKTFQEKGVNIARGRNIAISKAKEKIIFVSDAGCIIDKNWIKDTLKYFPKEDIVAGSYKAITRNNFEYFQSLIVIKKVTRPARMSSRNIAFKKECWKVVRGYPEKSLTGEDNRFNINLIEKGYKIKVNPKPLISWEMRPTLSKFSKQFYLYGRGDRIQGNLFKKTLKKNLVMVFGFWMYLVLFFLFVLTFPLIGLLMIFIPLFLLFIYSIKIFVKTGKISALFWVPVLIITKRLSYIMGVTFK
jgi:glycosyltransferase involved in cell wall biosynthesis